MGAASNEKAVDWPADVAGACIAAAFVAEEEVEQA